MFQDTLSHQDGAASLLQMFAGASTTSCLW